MNIIHKNYINLQIVAHLTPLYQRNIINYNTKQFKYKNPKNGVSTCYCYLIFYNNEYCVLYSHIKSNLNNFIKSMFKLPTIYTKSKIEGNLKNTIDQLPKYQITNIDSIIVMDDIEWGETIPQTDYTITAVRINYEKHYPEFLY